MAVLTVGGVVCRLARAGRIGALSGARLGGSRPSRADPSSPARAAGAAPPVLTAGTGPQRDGGVLLCQVDGTTCGPAVLTVLAASTDPGWLDTGAAGFGERFGAAQERVHRQANRWWPRFLGTTPSGLVRWLRRYAPAAGRYRVRWVDDTDPTGLTGALDAVAAAVRAGRPVPLMVGAGLPRHWVLAVGMHETGEPVAGQQAAGEEPAVGEPVDGQVAAGEPTGMARAVERVAGGAGRAWRVYEPSSGEVRVLEPQVLRERGAAPVLGWPRLHAALLPDAVPDPGA